jgi:hypothetical protein
MLIDKKNGLEITGFELSTETNFNGSEIYTIDQLHASAKQVDFPSHALIFRYHDKSVSGIVKGINSWDQLNKQFNKMISGRTSIYVETDMRAMHNPTRQKIITKARINSWKELPVNALCVASLVLEYPR